MWIANIAVRRMERAADGAYLVTWVVESRSGERHEHTVVCASPSAAASLVVQLCSPELAEQLQLALE